MIHIVCIMNQTKIGFVIMLKNEEHSIISTLLSIKSHAKYLFILDTGSTDNTIFIIKNFCEKNNITVHIKNTNFVNFAVSRNESLTFAESFCKKYFIKYLILLDAGDEFRCAHDSVILSQVFEMHFKFRLIYGIVKKVWKDGNEEIIHYDARVIKVGCDCRYDERYPVHETFKNKNNETMLLLNDLIILYQDRNKYGQSTENRLKNDIEMLSNAEPTNRNLYYLAQTFCSMKQYDNALKKYKEVLGKTKNDSDKENCDDMSKGDIYKAIINVYFITNNYDDCLIYIKKFIEDGYDDGYMYLMKYTMETKKYEIVEPYINKIFNLKTNKLTTINIDDYEYKRWHFLSLVCTELKKFDIAKESCKKAILAKNMFILSQ
jgi:tetratricopeptide (TPR) repeat protein